MCRVGNQRGCLLDYQTPIKCPLISNITSRYHYCCYCISLFSAQFCLGKSAVCLEKKNMEKVEERTFSVAHWYRLCSKKYTCRCRRRTLSRVVIQRAKICLFLLSDWYSSVGCFCPKHPLRKKHGVQLQCDTSSTACSQQSSSVVTNKSCYIDHRSHEHLVRCRAATGLFFSLCKNYTKLCEKRKQ